MKLSQLLAGLLFVIGFFVATSALAQNDVIITERARQHFKAGVAYIDDPAGPKYEEAYREFHIAYAESPSYRILTNIGLCALNLERDKEAIEAYETFLAKATAEDIPKGKRSLMERDIKMLKASLVTLTLTSKPTNIVLSDERLPTRGSSITNRYELAGGQLSLGIHPGHHRITASAEGYEPQTWDFEADSNSTHHHDFALKPLLTTTESTVKSNASTSLVVTRSPETDPKKGIPTLVYVGAATTGIFAIAATVTGLIANSKKSDYNRINATGNAPAQARDLRDSFKRYALLTDIGIGAAVLAAGTTAVLHFTAPRRTPETKSLNGRVHLTPTIGPAQAGFSISGQF